MTGQFFVASPLLGLVADGAAVKGCAVGTNRVSIAPLRLIGFAPWFLRFSVAAGTPPRHNPPRHIPSQLFS
jgi:hypothetical protein